MRSAAKIEEGISLDPIEKVIEAFRAGRPILMVDDDDRENEGDVCVATACLTAESVAFMAREARGLICVSIGEEVAQRLNLPLQTVDNGTSFGTPFTVTVDHASVVGRGVTAAGRAETMRALIDPRAVAADFVSPGHVFPLIAHPSGVLARRGQTEGSFDLARLAGLPASGVICEVLNSDGTVAKGRQIADFAARHAMPTTSVEEIARYRAAHEILLTETGSTFAEIEGAPWKVVAFEDLVDGKEHIAYLHGDLGTTSGTLPPLARLHSECLTGDILGSRRCDCGPQLEAAARAIVHEGRGVILYLRQEGRGIGLVNKLKAYNLQDEGHDTVEANLKLGFSADERSFRVGAKMLRTLGIDEIRLVTNNPRKLEAIREAGILVRERVSAEVPVDAEARSYLETKRDKFGHILGL